MLPFLLAWYALTWAMLGTLAKLDGELTAGSVVMSLIAPLSLPVVLAYLCIPNPDRIVWERQA